MSDTQRTDALFNTSMYADDKLEAWATLARKLETELAASEARVKELENVALDELDLMKKMQAKLLERKERIADLEARLAFSESERVELGMHNASWIADLTKVEKDRDRLHAKLARVTEALRIIAGQKQCVDNLLSNREIARAAIAEQTEKHIDLDQRASGKGSRSLRRRD